MSWVRVDDKIAFHRKVVAAGNEAFGAWMRMTAWCADQLSDGIVPASIAWVICGPGREEVIEALVKHNLLEREADHFKVHDYHDHNPLAADVKAKRDAASKQKKEAGARGGRVSGEVRSSRREAETKQTRSKRPSEIEAKRSPVPNPHPVPNPKEKEIAAAPPLPFRAAAAVEAIATASAGRFVASVLSAKKAIDIEAVIRTEPAIETWTLVGLWLSAGGDAWKGTLDVRHLGDVGAWLAQAKAWNASGRRPIAQPRQQSLLKPGNTAPSANFAEPGDVKEQYT